MRDSSASSEATQLELLATLQERSTRPEENPTLFQECALCKLTTRSVQQALRVLLTEFVNDPRLRDQWRSAKGLCFKHLPYLAETRDSLAIAILYSDLAEQTQTRWRNLPSKSLFPFGKKNVRPAPCLACDVETESEQRYASGLANALLSPSNQQIYRESPGLCVAHIELVLAQAKPPALQALLTIEQERLSHLYHELAEIIRKNDYRFRGEEWGDEKDAWFRALSKLPRFP